MTPAENIRFRLEKYRKVCAEYTRLLDEKMCVEDLLKQFYDIIDLRERLARCNGEVSALEFALEQLGEAI